MRLAVAVGILLVGFVGFRAADFYVETYDAAFAGWRDGYERVDDGRFRGVCQEACRRLTALPTRGPAAPPTTGQAADATD